MASISELYQQLEHLRKVMAGWPEMMRVTRKFANIERGLAVLALAAAMAMLAQYDAPAPNGFANGVICAANIYSFFAIVMRAEREIKRVREQLELLKEQEQFLLKAIDEQIRGNHAINEKSEAA